MHLNGANLAGADPSECDLATSRPGGFAAINRASLRGATLRGEDGPDLETDFGEADLTDADLAHAVLSGSSMRHAVLTNTDFSGVELATVNLRFANVSAALGADVPAFKGDIR